MTKTKSNYLENTECDECGKVTTCFHSEMWKINLCKYCLTSKKPLHNAKLTAKLIKSKSKCTIKDKDNNRKRQDCFTINPLDKDAMKKDFPIQNKDDWWSQEEQRLISCFGGISPILNEYLFCKAQRDKELDELLKWIDDNVYPDLQTNNGKWLIEEIKLKQKIEELKDKND